MGKPVYSLTIEPTAGTRTLMQQIARGPQENIATIIARAIMEEMANDPTIPHWEDDSLRTGWKVIAESVMPGAEYDIHWCLVANTETMVPEKESLEGPRPYDIGLGIEFGHREHWVAFAPKRLGGETPHRRKLMRWIRARGTRKQKEALARHLAGEENVAVLMYEYEPRPFVGPKIAEYMNSIEEKVGAALRRWLGAG